MLPTLLKWIFKPRAKFKVGESVQLIEGGHLMVVKQIIPSKKMNEPLILCGWYESETKENRTNIFPQSALKPFDWNANK
jgi:uncharacterized protein YodC (DUF2158 family)